MQSYENWGFSLNANVRIPSWDTEGLERLIRYCVRPCFASENLRWNGPWINYRLPKPTRDGKRFIQIEPLELIEWISKFIPYPRRHRRHYHGIFAPNSPLRKKIVIKIPRINPSQHVQEIVEKVEKISFNWAKLIARIYETNPLICSCGKEIKIIGFVTNQIDIRRILNGLGCPTEIPQFDPPYDFSEKEISQLISGTPDGFPEETFYFLEERGLDPPFLEAYDPPHPEDYCDPPHWID